MLAEKIPHPGLSSLSGVEGLGDAGEAAGGIGVVLSHGGAWPLVPAALMSVAPCATVLTSRGEGEGSLAQASNHHSTKLCSCPLESSVLCECSLLNELMKSI